MSLSTTFIAGLILVAIAAAAPAGEAGVQGIPWAALDDFKDTVRAAAGPEASAAPTCARGPSLSCQPGSQTGTDYIKLIAKNEAMNECKNATITCTCADPGCSCVGSENFKCGGDTCTFKRNRWGRWVATCTCTARAKANGVTVKCE